MNRKPYRILRGAISRREGDAQSFIDPETGVRTKRKSQSFVHYSAKTPRNPGARDEIMLTPEEARRLTLSGMVLKELASSTIKSSLVVPDKPSIDRDVILSLIEEGQSVRGAKNIAQWREKVFKAGVIDSELPTRRQDLLDVLATRV